jgi:hypothetical protein
MGILGRGLGFKTLRSWEKRTVTLDLWDWGRWLSVEMSAPAVSPLYDHRTETHAT